MFSTARPAFGNSFRIAFRDSTLFVDAPSAKQYEVERCLPALRLVDDLERCSSFATSALL